MSNVIGIVPPVAENVYAEDVGDGGNVVRECAGGEFLALVVDGAPHPQFLDFSQGERSAALESLQQPDVGFEIILCHN